MSSTPFLKVGANVLHGVFGAEPHQPFAAFNAKGDIDIEDRENEVITTFTSVRAATELILNQNVNLQVTGGTRA